MRRLPTVDQVAPPVTEEVTGEVTGEVQRLPAVMVGEMKRRDIQQALDLKHEDRFREVSTYF